MKPLALALALTVLNLIAPVVALADEQPQAAAVVDSPPQAQLPAADTDAIPDYVILDIGGY